MRITRLLAVLVALAPIYSASASVSISFSAGVIRQSNGTPVPLNAIGVLVVDSANNGFGTDTSIVGSTLTVGSSLGEADNIILQVFSAPDLGGGLIGFSDNVSYSYTGSLATAAGAPLELVWFPTISVVGATIAPSVSYGYYRTDSIDANSGADIGFIAPPDNFNGALGAFDNVTSPGAVASPSNLTASHTTTAVPEPSSVVLLVAGGFLMTGALLRRRKTA